jgi:hypothetical protein
MDNICKGILCADSDVLGSIQMPDKLKKVLKFSKLLWVYPFFST